MEYAIRKDGLGWRAVNGPEDVASDEIHNSALPGKNQKWDGTQWVDDIARTVQEKHKTINALTPEQTHDMGLTASKACSAVYAAAWAHKDAIKALVDGGATVEEIEAYDITTRWPE